MRIRRMTRALVITGGLLIAVALTGGYALAQQFEVHPYAGGFFPGNWADTTNVNKEGLYGVRGGVYLTDNVEMDGNFGYLNHFRFKDTPDAGVRGFLWDFNGAYNFSHANLKRAEPFVTFGLGGLTTNIRNAAPGQTVELLDPTMIDPNTTLTPIMLKDNGTFLTLNYGGGIKGRRLWGPVGLRADFRGRTMPNFFGRGLSWFEATGGINFMWGER